MADPPMANDPRALRGLAMLAEGTPIRKEGKNIWHVPSQTQPDVTYTVTRWAGHNLHKTRW